jgi:hypothetical protein
MGQELVKAPGGSVLMVDPQSPASLLAALRGLQNGSAEGAAARPSAQERSSLQPPHTRAEA